MSKDTQRGRGASSGTGFMLVALVVLFTLAGYWLDQWLHTSPWLMVAGVFVGFGLGFDVLGLDTIGRFVTPSDRKGEKDDDEGSDEGSS